MEATSSLRLGNRPCHFHHSLYQSSSPGAHFQGQGTQTSALTERSLRIQGHIYRLPQSDPWLQVSSVSLVPKILSPFSLLHTPYPRRKLLISGLRARLPSELSSRQIRCLIHLWIPCGCHVYYPAYNLYPVKVEPP